VDEKSRVAGQEKELQKLGREINRYLRRAYQANVAARPQLYNRPFGGRPEESIGPWPEFIYHGLTCPRSAGGFCSPCGYSNVDPVPSKRHAVYQSVLAQTDVILASLETEIADTQPPINPICVALSTIGSFFNQFELDAEYRRKVLQKFVSFQCRTGVDLRIFLEAHPADIIRSHKKGELEELNQSLQVLHTTVILGLESVDAFARNTLYLKGLELTDFELAVGILRSYGLEAGAFVFAGLHSLTELETIQDVQATLGYLRREAVLPVLMIANLKEFTLNHLLYWLGKYDMLDPRTIASLFRLLTEFAVDKRNQVPWLAADPVGGPPPPAANPFATRRKATCDACAGAILESIRRVREDYDWGLFGRSQRLVDRCSCKQRYVDRIEAQLAQARQQDLIQRVAEDLEAAVLEKERYVRAMSGE